MYSTSRSNRMIGLSVTSAMSAVLLTGCAMQAAPQADLSASKAEIALAKGKTGKAINNAEAAVLADPHNASYRAMLGATYLEAGRFASATTSFDDAMTLGDTSARTALSLALSLTGEGKNAEAVGVLNDRGHAIAPSDLGLAYALAGQPQRGVEVLSNAIRSGDNTAKTRQNLAYSYALNGQWREARLMAAEDVPGDEIGNRMQEWAVLAQPEAWQYRVALLVGAPAGVRDSGQPLQLALADAPSVEQLASEAAAYTASTAATELPPVVTNMAVQAESGTGQPADGSEDFETAFATISPSDSLPPVAHDTARFVQQPVVQTTAVRQSAAAKPTTTVAGKKSDGSHLVQLGSFVNEEGARRAWSIYVKRYPDLANHEMVITEAVVKGKRYWRVSAAGYSRASSNAMCGRVKSGGNGCIAYAKDSPPAGAVDKGTRMAMR